MSRSTILRFAAASVFAVGLASVPDGVRSESAAQSSQPSHTPGDFLTTPPKASTLKGKFSLVSLGDLLYSYPMANSKDPKFRKVVELIKSGDLTIANREGVTFNLKTLPSTGYGDGMLWGEASLAQDEKALGVDMVSLANNHATDWGGRALLQTKLLHEEAGVVTAGAGRNLDEARRAGILNSPKGRIALVATTSTFKANAGANDAFGPVGARAGVSILRTRAINLVPPYQMDALRKLATERASPLDPALTPGAPVVKFGDEIYRLADKPGLTYQMDLYDLAGLLKSVREAKNVADLVVFYIHTHQTATGDDDDTPAPPDFLINLAHDTINAGADVFMGGGLHTMRGIEIYKGKPIFYGLGSFFLNGEIDVLQETAFHEFPDADTGLPPKPKSKERSVRQGGNPPSWYDGVVAITDFDNGHATAVRLYPLNLGNTNDYTRSRRGIPHLADRENARRILTDLQRDSAQFGTKIAIEGSLGVIRLPEAQMHFPDQLTNRPLAEDLSMSKTKLAVAVLAVLVSGGLSQVCAQTTLANPAAPSQQNGEITPDTTPAKATETAKPKNVKKLKAVTVTGSLIPQTEIETATPIVTITSAQMKARGFTSVTQALQQASFSTGSVQGMQDTNSFSTGAETLSMFGLPIGFTKYLINGRPMGNFPGLYNGSDAFNSISGIPMDLVDHVDILPGGQSSLYGSDAIAGVINIVLKKSVDAPTIDVRYGWHSDGGGADTRISLADSFSVGQWTSLVGLQFENTQPIWAGDRSLTKQFSNGQGAPQAAPDYLVTSIFSGQYYFLDPNNCTTLSGQWNGTLTKQHRPGVGDWCGSLYTPAVATIANGQKAVNLYTHNTFDINEHARLYADLLYNYQDQNWSSGSSITDWNNLAYIGPFYDPRLDAEGLEIRHEFSPEEVGGYQNIMNEQIENSYMLTLGVQGTLGHSNWDYDLGFTHSDDKLNNHNHERFQSMEDYYDQHVMGPQLGTYDGLPVFEPNYAALYQPVSKAEFDSFTGYINNYSKTWDNLLRGQLTNASLFPLPGGDAGVAVALEGGNEGWSIDPDPRYAMGDVWGSYVTPGAGHRSRFAATTEFRLPVLPRVTLDVSGRYDDYKVSGDHVAHPTYNLGLEYRPVDSFLLRARYGTAFKAPTLADEFQAPSGSGTYIMDYVNCNRQGNGGVNFANCKPPYDSVLVEDETTGNPALKPITAKVWSYGFVWAPLDRMSLSVDYLHWSISNEVTQTSADQLSNTEYLCDIGTINPSSALCTEASSLITRSPIAAPGYLGAITTVSTPKLNLANELVNAITASFNYAKEFGQFGEFALAISYSDVLKHTTRAFPTDPSVDLLRNPSYSTDFKSKINGSITWSKNEWSATLYGNRYGSTPNNLATQLNSYAEPGTGKLAPWILYNASVTYHPMPKLALSLSVNNLFNKMPPVDTTYGNGPAPYNTDDYNVFGRAIFLEANYKFANK